MKTTSQLEKEIATIENERLTILDRCGAKIAKAEAIVNPGVRDTLVQAAQGQKDAAEREYSRLIAGRKLDLIAAQVAERAAVSGAELAADVKADARKASARRAWIASGGRSDDFDAAWQLILVAKTAARMDTPEPVRRSFAY